MLVCVNKEICVEEIQQQNIELFSVLTARVFNALISMNDQDRISPYNQYKIKNTRDENKESIS